jgi:hypothetical protein
LQGAATCSASHFILRAKSVIVYALGGEVMISKISLKAIAVWQLVAAAFISLSVYQLAMIVINERPPGSLFYLAAMTLFFFVNLIGGALLLKGTELGRKLSLGNFAAQVLAFNTPWIGYGYNSLMQIYVSAFINSPPGTYLAGAGFEFNPGRFWILISEEIPEKPQLAVDIISIAFCIVLFRAARGRASVPAQATA